MTYPADTLLSTPEEHLLKLADHCDTDADDYLATAGSLEKRAADARSTAEDCRKCAERFRQAAQVLSCADGHHVGHQDPQDMPPRDTQPTE